MKRNWDTIREILLATENLEPEKTLDLSYFEPDRAHDISYHVELLKEAGLVDAEITKTISRGPTAFFLKRLTWHGHELLDAIRNESVWNKTKGKFSDKGGEMTFELVKDVAISVTKSAMGL